MIKELKRQGSKRKKGRKEGRMVRDAVGADTVRLPPAAVWAVSYTRAQAHASLKCRP